jgi:hypothetical protein
VIVRLPLTYYCATNSLQSLSTVVVKSPIVLPPYLAKSQAHLEQPNLVRTIIRV